MVDWNGLLEQQQIEALAKDKHGWRKLVLSCFAAETLGRHDQTLRTSCFYWLTKQWMNDPMSLSLKTIASVLSKANENRGI